MKEEFDIANIIKAHRLNFTLFNYLFTRSQLVILQKQSEQVLDSEDEQNDYFNDDQPSGLSSIGQIQNNLMHKLMVNEKWFANSSENIDDISLKSHLTNVIRGKTSIDKKLQKALKVNDQQYMMQ